MLKHRKRKEKAVRKLEAMSANLARLTDLTTELRRQLKPLAGRPRSRGVRRRSRPICAMPGCGSPPTTSSPGANEFAGVGDAEAALRREHDEAAARLDAASAELSGHEAGGGEPDRARRTCAADVVSVIGAGRTGERNGTDCDGTRAAPRHRAGPDRGRRPGHAGRRGRRGRRHGDAGWWRDLDDARARLDVRPHRDDRRPSGSPPKPSRPTWRRCGPRRTGVRASPGSRARSTRCAPASSRSTRRWPGSPMRSTRPPPARSRRRRSSRPCRPASARSTKVRSASTSTTTDRWPRYGWPTSVSANCRRPNAAPNARWRLCSARIEALSVGLDRKDGAAWITENLSDAGLFGSLAKLVKVRAGLRGSGGDRARRRCGCDRRRRRDGGSLGGRGAQGSPTAAGPPSCSATGRHRPIRGRSRCPPTRSGRSTWWMPPERLRGAVAAMLSGVAVVGDSGGRARPGAPPPAAAGRHPRRRSRRRRLGQRRLRPAAEHAGDHLGDRDRPWRTGRRRDAGGRAGGRAGRAHWPSRPLDKMPPSRRWRPSTSRTPTIASAYEQLGRLGQDARTAEEEWRRLTEQREDLEASRVRTVERAQRTRAAADQRPADPGFRRRRLRRAPGDASQRRRRPGQPRSRRGWRCAPPRNV